MKTLAVIIAAVLALGIWSAPSLRDDSAPEVRLVSPFHDGHLWLCHPEGKWQPIHHPDCPCRDAIKP